MSVTSFRHEYLNGYTFFPVKCLYGTKSMNWIGVNEGLWSPMRPLEEESLSSLYNGYSFCCQKVIFLTLSVFYIFIINWLMNLNSAEYFLYFLFYLITLNFSMWSQTSIWTPPYLYKVMSIWPLLHSDLIWIVNYYKLNKSKVFSSTRWLYYTLFPLELRI